MSFASFETSLFFDFFFILSPKHFRRGLILKVKFLNLLRWCLWGALEEIFQLFIYDQRICHHSSSEMFEKKMLFQKVFFSKKSEFRILDDTNNISYRDQISVESRFNLYPMNHGHSAESPCINLIYGIGEAIL